MSREPERAYDSFVVRLWRDAATGRLLRAEVEHVQTGQVSAGRGVAPEWVLGCFRACLDGQAAATVGGHGRDAEPSGLPDSGSGTEPRW